MKEIRMDWETYREEEGIIHRDGYACALRMIIDWLEKYPHINDGFEIWDCDAYDHDLVKKVIHKINNLKREKKLGEKQ